MAKEVKKSELEKGEVYVNFTNEVSVIGAEKSPHLKTGKEYKVHPVHAEKLVKNGHATIKK